jgi:hypothetical protein
MKFFLSAFAFTGSVILLLISCENQSQKEARLAHQYCSSCHLFPEPSLLNKESWEKSVLPQMAFRMGFPDSKILSSFPEEDLETVVKSLPGKPMVTEAEWLAIKNYYINNAPDSLAPAPERRYDSIKTFNIHEIKFPWKGVPLLTLIKNDSLNNKIYIGLRTSKLFQFNNHLAIEDSFPVPSPVSHILFQKDEPPILSAMGIMDPNDQAKGSMRKLSPPHHSTESFIDSLKRPVYFEKADLNNDQREDYVICSFGNFTGGLLAYESMGNGKFKKHQLLDLPGARKVIVKDFTNDGLNDILVLMTQGDEQISLLTNAGNFNFRITTLLRFPPVYGSSYFDIIDFNHDGKIDIVYTNGDNADHSIILKPYHGVHIYLNNGKNEFKEHTFLQMYGASQAIAHDFDQDGDIDLAAISFFPRFNHPEEGFIYFENNGKDFTPQTTVSASSGRWLIMESFDYDHDGDLDILLGALDFNNGVPVALLNQWKEKRTALLLLQNNRN